MDLWHREKTDSRLLMTRRSGGWLASAFKRNSGVQRIALGRGVAPRIYCCVRTWAPASRQLGGPATFQAKVLRVNRLVFGVGLASTIYE
jgi:hypothetical protein